MNEHSDPNSYSWCLMRYAIAKCIRNSLVGFLPQIGIELPGELFIAVVVPKCFIKHMCFIVLYFHGHAVFSLEIAKKCFFVLYFLKNVLYFCKLFKWVEFLFQVFIYNTKIVEL